MERYNPVLVTLHWLMAILILLALFFGKVVIAPLSDGFEDKLTNIAGHMIVGLVIGALLIARLIVRLRSPIPPHAQTGNALLDILGKASHWVFYVLIAVMVVSGISMSMSAGLMPMALGGAEAVLPSGFETLVPRRIHIAASSGLILLILMHLGATAYHMLLLRDGLIKRMWFGS